jgi:acid phosphatase family membrane protein YuiD
MLNIKTSRHQLRNTLSGERIAIVAALLTVLSIAAPASEMFDLRALANKAEIIVVGSVVSVNEVATTEVSVANHQLPARILEARVTVDRTLKGEHVPPEAVVRFIMPITPAGSVGYQGLVANSYQMLFLKQVDAHFEFADPSSAALPALPRSAITTSRDLLTTIASELESVLASPQVSEAVKLSLMYRMGSIPAATNALVTQLTAPSATLRFGAASALLQLNYLPALTVAEGLLIRPPAGVPKYLVVNLCSAIDRYVKDERAIPTLRLLLDAPDPETRRAAASALRNTGSSRAIPALASALDDGDEEVRYYGVIGLGEITNQPDWRPLMDEFVRHEHKYIQHWREWSTENGVVPK